MGSRQFLNYRLALQMSESDRMLYLAVPIDTYVKPVDGIYQQRQYRLGDMICSHLFPNLQLKLDDVCRNLC